MAEPATETIMVKRGTTPKGPPYTLGSGEDIGSCIIKTHIFIFSILIYSFTPQVDHVIAMDAMQKKEHEFGFLLYHFHCCYCQLMAQRVSYFS